MIIINIILGNKYNNIIYTTTLVIINQCFCSFITPGTRYARILAKARNVHNKATMLLLLFLLVCLGSPFCVATIHTKTCVEEFYPVLVPTKGSANSKIAAEHPSCKTIHFIRHAEGHHNVADRKHGTEILTYENSGDNFTDARLTENGIRQSRALKSVLKRRRVAMRSGVSKSCNSKEKRYLDIML